MKKIFLKNPLTLISFLFLGILCGIYYKNFSFQISILGNIYLSLLKMCVIPILITAIISSVARLFQFEDAKKYIIKIVSVFLIFMFFTGIIAIGLELISKPGKNLGKNSERVLGKILNKSGKSDDKKAIVKKGESIVRFIKNIVPENIFYALSKGFTLQILFFTIILGIATGFLPPDKSNLIISLSEALFKAFFKIIEWLMYLLPFGLFALIARQIAGTGVEILLAMMKFIISVYVICIVLMLINGFVIKFFTKTGFIKSFVQLKECLLIGFGTQSTFASIPSAIEGLTENLGLNKEIINLVIPIGAVICRFSMVILYSSATIFTAQLYDVHIGIGGVFVTLILSVVAAIAGAGTPGIVSIAMISMILHPLGLPVEAIVVLLLAVNPLVEPITTLTNVHSNCAVSSVIAKKE